TTRLLLLAQVLELGVDDFAFLRTRGLGRAGLARRALGLLRLPVHDLGQLVGRLGERLLGLLHALEILTLERFLCLRQRVLHRLAVGLGPLAAVFAHPALGRVHERIGLVADLDLLLALGVLGRVGLG